MKRKKADEIDNRRPARPPWHSAMNQNGGGSDVKREEKKKRKKKRKKNQKSIQ